MKKLEGRVALVTGAGRNIGRATILKLASEGADVIVNARSNQAEADSVAEEAHALGVKAMSVLADVSDPQQVESMVSRAMEEFGKIDILINNAAIRPHMPFTEVSLEDWERVRGVILDGSVYCTRQVIPSMAEQGYGRVLFFTGDGSYTGGADRAHVSAAKMGLVGLARALATEFAPKNSCEHRVSRQDRHVSRHGLVSRGWHVRGHRNPPGQAGHCRRHRIDLPVPGLRRLRIHNRSDDPC